VVRKCGDTSQRGLNLGNEVFRKFQGRGCVLLDDGKKLSSSFSEEWNGNH
jgi:hypothetical protein